MGKKDWEEELQDIINREMFKEDLMIQIKSLVEQELDRAREEGYEKGYEKGLEDLHSNDIYIKKQYIPMGNGVRQVWIVGLKKRGKNCYLN